MTVVELGLLGLTLWAVSHVLRHWAYDEPRPSDEARLVLVVLGLVAAWASGICYTVLALRATGLLA